MPRSMPKPSGPRRRSCGKSGPRSAGSARASARSWRSSIRRCGCSSAARATTRSRSSARRRCWDGTSPSPTIAPRSSHRERFPEASGFVALDDPSDAAKAAGVDERTYVVVMSHHFLRDKEYVRSMLGSPAAYVGMLGPGARTERLLDGAPRGRRGDRGPGPAADPRARRSRPRRRGSRGDRAGDRGGDRGGQAAPVGRVPARPAGADPRSARGRARRLVPATPRPARSRRLNVSQSFGSPLR